MNQIIRSESGDASAASPELGQKLASFEKQRVLNLESYKKNGDAKRTPVIFVEDNGRLYFQTAVKAWKAKRVMRNPRVRVAPSTFRGEPKGDWIDATATKVEDEEVKRIRRVFGRKFGFFSRVTFFVERLAWGKIAFFSIEMEREDT
jgi:uncharacterized protein